MSFKEWIKMSMNMSRPETDAKVVSKDKKTRKFEIWLINPIPQKVSKCISEETGRN